MIKAVYRRASLDEKTKEELHEKVKELMNNGDQGSEPNDQEDESEGSIFLFDASDHNKNRVALEFNTQKDFERYKKQVKKMDPKTKVKILNKDDKINQEEGGRSERPIKQDDSKKTKVEKDEVKPQTVKKEEVEVEKNTKVDNQEVSKPGRTEKLTPKNNNTDGVLEHSHPSRIPVGTKRQVAIKDSLIDQFGVDAKEWKVHSVSKVQLEQNVTVHFPDGTKKKVGELSKSEIERVEKALSEGLAASKGLCDYTSVTQAAFQDNIKINLNRYDDKKTKEIINADDSLVTKDSVSEVVSSLRDNGRTLINKYRKALSIESRPMVEKIVDDLSSTVNEAIQDGSLSGVKQSDLDSFVRDSVKVLLHQEIESRRRAMGDHGVRHVSGNCKSSLQMLNELQNHGISVTGKDKLAAMAVMIDHDIGYTVGEAGTSATKGKSHKGNSKELSDQNPERMDKIFGKDGGDKIRHIIDTHDSTDIDWDKDVVGSTVRLADNASLFGEEKACDLFLRSNKATGVICKLRLAVETSPEDKELQKVILDQLHDVIDEENFDSNDKEAMHALIGEMSENKYWSSSEDILSRFSGKLDGFKFNPDKKIMHVKMKYSSEGQMVDSMFGDRVAQRQFKKFTEDMGGTPVRGKKSHTVFKNPEGKSVFQLDIDGIDTKPTFKTTAMQNFANQTARVELKRALMLVFPPPQASKRELKKAKGVMEPVKDKFTTDEWNTLMSSFDEENDNPGGLVDKLTAWPLLKSESAFLKSKTAAQILARKIRIGFLTNQLADTLLARSGIQTRRKDKDLMRDTGGISKNRQREPLHKPPRYDSARRYRTKDKAKEDRDPDVDTVTSSCVKNRKANIVGAKHPLDKMENSQFGFLIPVNNYHRQVLNCLIHILQNSRNISEKSFSQIDSLKKEVYDLIKSDLVEEIISTSINVNARPNMCAEEIYHKVFVKNIKSSVGFEGLARGVLSRLPRTFKSLIVN